MEVVYLLPTARQIDYYYCYLHGRLADCVLLGPFPLILAVVVGVTKSSVQPTRIAAVGFDSPPSIIMLVFLGHGPRTTICQALALLFVLSQFAAVVGLRTTPGSPCEDVCHRRSTNTTSREMVCLDSQYNTTSVGSTFRECVSCQLGSNYTGEAVGESDVSWGLCMQSFKSLSHRI